MIAAARRWGWRAALVCLLMAGRAEAQTRHVVVVYDERIDLPGLSVIHDGLVTSLLAGTTEPLEIYREEMDLSRFGDRRIADFAGDLRDKYRDTRVDVVVAVMGPALDFALDHRDVFGGAPTVFAGIDRRELERRTVPADVTGVLLRREFAPTLDLVLRLHPATTRIVFIGGTSSFDRRLVDAARREFAGYERRTAIEFVTDRSRDDLLQFVSTLPAGTVVLTSTVFQDGAGQAFVPHDLVGELAAAASVPVYGFVDQFLGRGIVGGHMYSTRELGEAAGTLALRVLGGTAPSALPFVDGVPSRPMFDWRQLQRWHVSERLLPAGSVVAFREATAWERYRVPIVATLFVVGLQLGLIVALLAGRRSRLRTQRALEDSEARTAMAGLSLGVGFWTWDPDGDHVWMTEQCAHVVGRPVATGMSLAAFIDALHPPPHAARLLETAVRDGRAYRGEWPIREDGGSDRWLSVATRPSVEPHSRRVTAVVMDVTERRQMEQLAEEQRRAHADLARFATLAETSAAIAHELRQPLMAILTHARVARHVMERQAPELAELGESLDAIVKADRRADAIISRVRAMARPIPMPGEALDVNEVIHECIDLVSADSRLEGVALHTHLGLLPPVEGDRIQLQQVVTNLLINAADALDGLAPPLRSLDIETAPAGDRVTITVRDRGPGIPAADIGRIFDPFVTSKPNGLGLGLSICRRIVQSHGGEITVANTPSGGAAFTVALPVVNNRPFTRALPERDGPPHSGVH